MKVILIRSRAIDQAVYKIAETLSSNGYDVTLLVWDRQNNLIHDKNLTYNVSSFKLNAPYDKYSALFYLPFWLLYETLYLLKYDFDIVHSCDLDTIIPAIFLKLFKKFKLCYIIYDFYANNLPDGSFKFIRKNIRNFVAAVERYSIGFTDVLFLVDETRYQEVRGAKIKILAYLYNSPKELDVAFLIPKPRIKKDLVILYIGLVLKSRGIEHMINAVNELENTKLILAGSIKDTDILSKIDPAADKIQYIGWISSYQEVIRKTLASDILFRFSDPIIPKTKYESPNKLFEAMMCGKPIIVSDNSSMADIVRRENCGLVIQYGDIEAIKYAINKLMHDNVLYNRLGENGRDAYVNRYSWNIMEKRLIDAYSNLK